MKIFKKLMALTLAVLMLLTSMTVVSFADGEVTEETTDGTKTFVPVTKWLVPVYGTNSKGTGAIGSGQDSVYRNGTANSYLTHEYAENNNLTPEEWPAENGKYIHVRQQLGPQYLNKTGISFKPGIEPNSDNPYYELYVDLVTYTTRQSVDLVLEVKTETYYHQTLEALSNETTRHELTKIGTIKLSNKDTDEINIWLPYSPTYTADLSLDFGGVYLKQIEGTTEPADFLKDNTPKWLYMTSTDGTNIDKNVDNDNFSYTTYNQSTSASEFAAKLASAAKPNPDEKYPSDAKAAFARFGVSGYTKQTGVSFTPKLSNTVNPYYEVWVELAGHSSTYDVPLNIEIIGDDGVYTGKLPKLTTSRASTWERAMYKVGNIKLSDSTNNRINIWLPLDTTYSSKTDSKSTYCTIGNVKLVPLYGTPTEQLRLSHVLEPIASRYGAWGNNFANVGGAATNNYTKFTETDKYGIGLTGDHTERSYGTSYTPYVKDTARNTYIYKGLWKNNPAQEGWYKIYIDRVVYNGSNPVPFLTINVLHEYDAETKLSKSSNYILDRGKNGNGFKATRHYVGTFKMLAQGTEPSEQMDQIRIYAPGLVDAAGGQSLRTDLGAIICVPVTEEEAIATKSDELTAESDLYFNPVYTADFTDEFTNNSDSEVEWYSAGRYHQLALEAKNGETTIQTVAYDNASADLKEALKFNEGVIDFDLYWTYTQGVYPVGETKPEGYEAPYFSVVLGKSATQTAEIRIYGNKAQLIETGLDSEGKEKITKTDLYVPTDYLRSYMLESKPSTLKNKAWKANCRIEIVDVKNSKLINGLEATSRLESADGATNGATKLLKVYINGGHDYEECIGVNYIPAGSVLYSKNDEVSDNYIKFVNNPGANTTDQTNLIKVRNLSISVPSDLTSGDEASVETKLKVVNGKGTYALETFIPLKYTNTLGVRRASASYAKVIAKYQGEGVDTQFIGAVADEVSISAGDKAKINLELPVTTGDKIKFFQWDNFGYKKSDGVTFYGMTPNGSVEVTVAE